MNLNKFAKEVHQNAVDHGFWEDERDITETGIDCNSWLSRPWPMEERFHPTNWRLWKSIVPTGR